MLFSCGSSLSHIFIGTLFGHVHVLCIRYPDCEFFQKKKHTSHHHRINIEFEWFFIVNIALGEQLFNVRCDIKSAEEINKKKGTERKIILFRRTDNNNHFLDTFRYTTDILSRRCLSEPMVLEFMI